MFCLEIKLMRQRRQMMKHKESAEGVVLTGTISPGGKA